MDIMNIFYRSLGVTSHTKTFLTVCRFRTDLVSILTARGIRSKKIVIRLNDLGYLFEKSCFIKKENIIERGRPWLIRPEAKSPVA